MKTVKGSRQEAGAGHRLEHIHIKRAANGFAIHKGYAGPDGAPAPMPGSGPASVFQKQGPAMSHVRDAMQEMHGQDGDGMDGGDMTGTESGPGQEQ